MKHLKKFNESVQDDKVEELKEFCNSSLAYLIDDGYEIRYYFSFDFKSMEVHLTKRDSSGFNWIDVKYDYIPFLESLSKKYNIHGWVPISNPEFVEVLFEMRNIRSLKYTVKDILNDDLKNTPIYSGISTPITWIENDNINITNKQMQNRYKKFSIESIKIKVKI